MTYPAIYRQAEYLIVGMGSNARKSPPLHSFLYETRFFGEKSWEQ